MSQGTKIYLQDVGDEIRDRLDYGDNLSEWVREACRMRMEIINDDDPTFTDPEDAE